MNLTGDELRNHYGLLPGTEKPWQVQEVNLRLESEKVDLLLEWTAGASAQCPCCGRNCRMYDLAPERSWRHLDTM